MFKLLSRAALRFKLTQELSARVWGFNNRQSPTLKSGINVLAGINVLVGKLVKNNKRTGWNKRTGGKNYQDKYASIAA